MSLTVLNANTLAVSEYSIAALDVVEHGGEVFFVTPAGLKKLANPADADEGPVLSCIETGALTLAAGQRINLWRVLADLAADAPLTLTTRLGDAGRERVVRYRVPPLTSGRQRAREVQLARGPRAEQWALRLETAAGGNWALGSLAVVPGAMQQGR